MTDPSPATATATAPTLVLVHGAWHGSWAWDRVVQRMDAQGQPSACVDLPSSGHDAAALGGLLEDVAEVRRVLDGIDGPKVLVGHSYGGMPTSAAAAGREDVVGVVYLSAFVLDEGATLLATVGGEPPAFWVITADGSAIEAPEPMDRFYADCSREDAEWAASKLGLQSWSSTVTPLPPTAHGAVPTTYVVTDADQALPAFMQEAMVGERPIRVVHLDSGHSPFLNKPDELSRILLEAVALSTRS